MSSTFSFPIYNVFPHLVISVSDWMSILLPLAVERGTCIITNMGAGNDLLYQGQYASYCIAFIILICFSYISNTQLEVDPLGAQQVVLDLTTKLGLDITIAAVYEVFKEETSGVLKISRSCRKIPFHSFNFFIDLFIFQTIKFHLVSCNNFEYDHFLYRF